MGLGGRGVNPWEHACLGADELGGMQGMETLELGRASPTPCLDDKPHLQGAGVGGSAGRGRADDARDSGPIAVGEPPGGDWRENGGLAMCGDGCASGGTGGAWPQHRGTAPISRPSVCPSSCQDPANRLLPATELRKQTRRIKNKISAAISRYRKMKRDVELEGQVRGGRARRCRRQHGPGS